MTTCPLTATFSQHYCTQVIAYCSVPFLGDRAEGRDTLTDLSLRRRGAVEHGLAAQGKNTPPAPSLGGESAVPPRADAAADTQMAPWWFVPFPSRCYRPVWWWIVLDFMADFSVKEEKPTGGFSPEKLCQGHWQNPNINHIVFQVHCLK